MSNPAIEITPGRYVRRPTEQPEPTGSPIEPWKLPSGGEGAEAELINEICPGNEWPVRCNICEGSGNVSANSISGCSPCRDKGYQMVRVENHRLVRAKDIDGLDGDALIRAVEAGKLSTGNFRLYGGTWLCEADKAGGEA